MTIKNRRTRNKSIRRTIKKGRRTSRKRGQSIRKVKATRKRSSTRKRASTRKRSSKRKRSSTRKRRSTRELRNVVLGGSGLGEWRTLIPQVTEEIAESDTMKCLERRENNVRTLMGDGFTIGDAMEGNHEYESAHIDYCNKNEQDNLEECLCALANQCGSCKGPPLYGGSGGPDEEEEEDAAARRAAGKSPKVSDDGAHFSTTDNKWVWNKPGHEDQIIANLNKHLITLRKICKVNGGESEALIPHPPGSRRPTGAHLRRAHPPPPKSV